MFASLDWIQDPTARCYAAGSACQPLALARRIFDRFAKSGSALIIARERNAPGKVTERRVCATGIGGGRPWTKGAVYNLPANRVYLGEAVHRGVAHAGEQAAIIDQRTWTRSTSSWRSRHTGAAPRHEHMFVRS